MKQMVFVFDEEKCIACGACTVACMDQNDIDPRVEKQFRHISLLEKFREGKVSYSSLSTACMHCADAPCVKACPTSCLHKDEETGLTLYDNSVCIGCHSCIMACPFDAPSFTPGGKMFKCDGCITRQENGLEPACVRVCPFDALKVEWVDTQDADDWRSILSQYGKK